MASWNEFDRQAPELAGVARRLMGAHRHRVLATLRKDGSPRVSGIETSFMDGDLWIGSMSGALKVFDLRRDPRMAIHAASDDPAGDDPSTWEGDLKLSGRAVEVTGDGVPASFQSPEPGSHLFRIELTEAVWTRVEGDELVMDAWHEATGVRRFRRK
ncbi:pyridoxamine 5'-phosphate oxidase family protein [Nonomuraea sp. K274]|uniref:Pyridoxamine 5'-phosphate oxidase family protein n=1 Tax=Nonomuraea cypriaca TaxID=1187855 RepID=A0A931F2H4_9ACTN|nr:pyridoxamine 5'-phosphate oxidase family protein [Nonomuraea cypriaca]MBF8189051.1 pyridoxamine 5'-phosphate oxidase family protein [Nonomuraea cypriaca]